MAYYKIKYKAIKVGENECAGFNKKDAIRNSVNAVKNHIQGNVKVEILSIKELH